MKLRKIPKRMCTGCLESKNKKDLIRIVRTKDGEVSVDITGKKAGRGAYICRSFECLEKAFKTKRLEKNLQEKISNELYEKLKSEISND